MAGTTSQLTRAPRLHKLPKKQRAHTLGPHSLSSNPCSAIPGRGVLGRPLTFSGKGDGEGAQLHSITGEAEELKLLVDWVGGRGKKEKQDKIIFNNNKKSISNIYKGPVDSCSNISF